MNANQQRLEQRRGRAYLRRNNCGRYSLSQSPLWRLTSIHRLATVLQVEVGLVRQLCLNPNYRQFVETSVKPGKAPRAIQVPTDETLRLHYRIAKLIDSIERPDFLHSATKRRSYVTNARAHATSDGAFVTIDIRKFFESTTYLHVKNFFHVELECSLDIAKCLATLCVSGGRLPTGSPLSSLMSYFVHRKLFEKVSQLSAQRGVTMTLYVDDMTFSGKGATRTFQFEVQLLVRQSGLKPHPTKNVCIRPGKPTIVTGVVISEGEILVRNRQHKMITELQDAAVGRSDGTCSQLAGHMAAAKAVNGEAAKKLKQRLRHLQRSPRVG